MKHIIKHNKNMEHILLPLVLALLVLLTSCTEYERRRRDRSSDITIEGGYNGGNVYSKMDDDYAIGGTTPSIFSDPSQQSVPTSTNYGNYGNYGPGRQSTGGSGTGGGTSSSNGQLNGFNPVGGVIALNDKGPGQNFDVQTQSFVPLGSGWLVLAAAGAGYAFVKRRKKD